MVNVPTTKFWREVVLRRFPDAEIRFSSELPFPGLGCRRDEAVLVGRSVWFHSPETYLTLYFHGSLDPVLAHEYVHMRQRSREAESDRWVPGWMQRWWPQTVLPAAILASGFAFGGLSWAHAASAALCLLPWATSFRVGEEVEAYSASVLASAMQLAVRGIDRGTVCRWLKGLPAIYAREACSVRYWASLATPNLRRWAENRLSAVLWSVKGGEDAALALEYGTPYIDGAKESPVRDVLEFFLSEPHEPPKLHVDGPRPA